MNTGSASSFGAAIAVRVGAASGWRSASRAASPFFVTMVATARRA